MPKAASKTGPVWIYNPWLDLIVGCGAWSAPLLLFSSFANASALAWSVSFYSLALVFNYPHYMATIYRAYRTREDFEKYRLFTVHITGLVLVTLIVTHFWYRALPWLFTLYLTWSPWHYSGQNYGLFMMFARRAGARPSQGLRRSLYALFLISYGILFLNFHTGLSSDPLFISLRLPGGLSSTIVLGLGLSFVILSAFALPRLAQQIGWREMLPSLTLFSTQFIWFLLPTALSLGAKVPIPQSRYSNGVLAVMHSAQYLWITSYYARREASGEGGRWRPFAYFAVLLIGGIALFVPGPWLASRVFHYDFSSSVLLFTALVNIHHFILDGAIWKLRDGRIANLLLNSRERLTHAGQNAGEGLAVAGKWLVGASRRARALRIGTAIVLLALGTVDQVRYYLSLRTESLADLRRAAELASFDSSVQMKIARKELEGGKAQDAALALRQALRANPNEPAARDLLLRYLIGEKQYDQAWAIANDSLRYAPKDVNLLVNRGILAQQLGHPDQAVQSWEKAAALDPRSAASLYLASEMDQQGKLEPAIAYYGAYLEGLSRRSEQSRPPADQTIAVVLRLAECQRKANLLPAAERSYTLAGRLAAQSGMPGFESMASVNLAQIASAQNRPADAMRSYQHALSLDSLQNDPRTEAADWYSYGLLLRDSGFPARLAYASLLKAEQLSSKADGSKELASIARAREAMEKTAGLSPKEVRSNLQAAVDEALHLQPR